MESQIKIKTLWNPGGGGLKNHSADNLYRILFNYCFSVLHKHIGNMNSPTTMKNIFKMVVSVLKKTYNK